MALLEAGEAVGALFRGEDGAAAELGSVLLVELLARAAGAIGSR